MSAHSQFKAEVDGHIAWLTMNRPEKRNTMGVNFFKELSEHLANFDQDTAIRVVIIKAEGKSFTAGTDLEEAGSLLSGQAADQREATRKKILKLQEGITRIENCSKPVIAAIHSHCIGGGIDLISACDIRIATADAVFSIRETPMGIIADLGTLQPQLQCRRSPANAPDYANMSGPRRIIRRGQKTCRPNRRLPAVNRSGC
jgi:enoyl-CoA hydratase